MPFLKKLGLLPLAIASVLGASAVRAAEVSGIVYPLHDLTLSTGVGGVVLSKDVALGQAVKAQQVLLVLDDREQAIELHKRSIIMEDRSAVDAENKRAEILKELYDQATKVFDSTGAISKEELLHARSDWLTEQAKYEQIVAEKAREVAEFHAAELELKLRSVTAPVGGVVTRIYVEPGEWAKPGDPLVHLVDASTCYLKIALALPQSAKVHVGQATTITFRDGSATLQHKGQYSFVSPAADPASGLIEARVVFDNARAHVRPGIKASVEID
jgi:RND family efflux transporter MFP subunit